MSLISLGKLTQNTKQLQRYEQPNTATIFLILSAQRSNFGPLNLLLLVIILDPDSKKLPRDNIINRIVQPR